MGIKPEAASPSSVYRCTQRYGGMAAFGSGCKPDKLGGYCVVFQALFKIMGVQAPYSRLYPYFARISSIGRGFDTPYRDACTIGKGLL